MIIKILAYLKVIFLKMVKYCHQKLLLYHIINKKNLTKEIKRAKILGLL